MDLGFVPSALGFVPRALGFEPISREGNLFFLFRKFIPGSFLSFVIFSLSSLSFTRF